MPASYHGQERGLAAMLDAADDTHRDLTTGKEQHYRDLEAQLAESAAQAFTPPSECMNANAYGPIAADTGRFVR